MAQMLLFLLLSVVSLSFVSSVEVLFSAQATTVEVGQSIKLRCELANYNQSDAGAGYEVLFYLGNNFYSYYSVGAPNSAGRRATTFQKYAQQQPTLGRQPVSSTFPVYEIMVTPTVARTAEFWCRLNPFGSKSADVNSNRVSITAMPHPPRATLTSNVTTMIPSQPLTLTCTLDRFNPFLVNYAVTFSSLRDGQLAAFEVTNGKALLSAEINSRVEVSPGSRSTFPTFDLALTEKVDPSSVYWCALEEKGKEPVRSASWPTLVQFVSSKSSESQRLGTCAIGANSLNLTGKAYSVQFFTDLGAKSVNPLAVFTFNPNVIEVFKFNHLAPWTSVQHGPNTAWPVFSILANGTSLHGSWWCVLAVGTQGTPDYHEFKSNTSNL